MEYYTLVWEIKRELMLSTISVILYITCIITSYNCSDCLKQSIPVLQFLISVLCLGVSILCSCSFTKVARCLCLISIFETRFLFSPSFPRCSGYEFLTVRLRSTKTGYDQAYLVRCGVCLRLKLRP